MNKKLLLFLTLSIFGISNIAAKQPKAKTCKCYCSVKCGPRDARPGKDKPFFNKKYKMCFCADRDLRLYEKNGCNLKPKPKNINCCKKK